MSRFTKNLGSSTSESSTDSPSSQSSNPSTSASGASSNSQSPVPPATPRHRISPTSSISSSQSSLWSQDGHKRLHTSVDFLQKAGLGGEFAAREKFKNVRSIPSDQVEASNLPNLAQLQKENPGGQTHKKIMANDGKIYLVKYNGRSIQYEDEDGNTVDAALPSREMDLEENNEQTFTEMCALRLFQYMWRPDAAPESAKIVLSAYRVDTDDAERNKRNEEKKGTKTYFASQMLGKSFMYSEHETMDIVMEDKTIQDELSKQIIIMAILANLDAAKFSNIVIEDDNQIRQIDFGNARAEDYSSADAFGIFNYMRGHADRDASTAVKNTLDEKNNVLYKAYTDFYKKNVTPAHILEVIEKLESLDLKELWHIAFLYTYGNEEEKKSYADCLIARVQNFIKSKDSIKEWVEENQGNEQEFAKESTRNILARNLEFRESRSKNSTVKSLNEIVEFINEDFARIENFEEGLTDDKKVKIIKDFFRELSTRTTQILAKQSFVRQRLSSTIDKVESSPTRQKFAVDEELDADGSSSEDDLFDQENIDGSIDYFGDELRLLLKWQNNISSCETLEECTEIVDLFENEITDDLYNIYNAMYLAQTHIAAYETLKKVENEFEYKEETAKKIADKFKASGIVTELSGKGKEALQPLLQRIEDDAKDSQEIGERIR